MELLGPGGTIRRGAVAFGGLEGLTEHRVDSIGRLLGLWMSVTINHEFMVFVKQFFLVQVGSHLGYKLADVVGPAGDKAFGGAYNFRVGFAQNVCQVKVDKQRTVIGGSVLIEKVEADGVNLRLQVQREQTVIQPASTSDIGRNVGRGSMHVVDDVVQIQFCADGSHESGILAQRFVEVPNDHDVFMVALAGADIAGDILDALETRVGRLDARQA
jgi:hypothetical protein